MKLLQLHEKLREYIYMEDTGVLDVALASVISNRSNLSGLLWLAIVGESSGGKSQIIDPIAQSDNDYFIKVDDVTENTFLSGMHKGENSLLTPERTNNTLAMTDLTVLFSRNGDSRNAILSQFRKLFDGEMTKRVGTMPEPLYWKGRMGMIAGCTPSIYSFFEEVADMGERFIYYRIPKYDEKKATYKALTRTISSTQLNDELAGMFKDYIKNVSTYIIPRKKELHLSDEMLDHILELAVFAELVRTPVKTDKYTGVVTNKPTPAYPMRTAQQFKSLAYGLQAMNEYEGEEVINIKKRLDQVAFSMANEDSRLILTELAKIDYHQTLGSQQIGTKIGMPTMTVSRILDRLHAVGVLTRFGSEDEEGYGNGLTYRIGSEYYYKLIKRFIS